MCRSGCDRWSRNQQWISSKTKRMMDRRRRHLYRIFSENRSFLFGALDMIVGTKSFGRGAVEKGYHLVELFGV